jgi:hypothetical protein
MPVVRTPIEASPELRLVRVAGPSRHIQNKRRALAETDRASETGGGTTSPGAERCLP